MAKVVVIEYCTDCPHFRGEPRLDYVQICGFNGGRRNLNDPGAHPPIVAEPGIPADCPLEDAP